eukprot:4005433-Karenia_brevis.AAC.1
MAWIPLEKPWEPVPSSSVSPVITEVLFEKAFEQVPFGPSSKAVVLVPPCVVSRLRLCRTAGCSA